MKALQSALNSLYATKIEEYHFDLVNRKICLRCMGGQENMTFDVVIFGTSLFAGVDTNGERYNAFENLENDWLECTEILVLGDKADCIGRGDFSSRFPNSSISANLMIDIWGCLYLYIHARGIIINGEEFLL